MVSPRQAQLGSSIIGLAMQSSQHIAHMASHCLQFLGKHMICQRHSMTQHDKA